MSDFMMQALTARATGDNAQAKRLLSQALIQQPNNEAAWILLAELVDDIKQRRNCLERVLAINPDNAEARKALSKLSTSPLAPVTRGERDKPLNPQVSVKTPPFTWEGDQSQYLDAQELALVRAPVEEPPLAEDTPPTFDWANETDEPDEAIEKLSTAVSNPESVYQPQSSSDLSWLNASRNTSQEEAVKVEEETSEAHMLDELVGIVDEAAPDEGFSTESVWQPKKGEYTAQDMALESAGGDFLLWDNPKVRSDRMLILTHQSMIIASPKKSDIPHIMGLFAEKKMVRDLLGKKSGLIRLDSITRLTGNPGRHNLLVEYKVDKKPRKILITLSKRKVLNEVIDAIQLRLGSSFTESVTTFTLFDKLIPPIVVLALLSFLGWLAVAGLPILANLPSTEVGQLQTLISTLQGFVLSVGVFKLVMILAVFAMLTLIWLLNDISKPSRLIVLEQRRPASRRSRR